MIDVSTLPPELWMAVFTKLDRPCDHASVALTCTTFRDLGFRLLYRRLVWRIEEMTNIHSHLETWNRNSHMVAVPVEATIRKHDPWGHGSAQYQKIVDRLGTFTNLKTLNFIDTTLPQRLHSVIHNFPCLRELRIRNCLLDRKAVNERTVLMQHHRLPIQELEIGKITQTRPLNQQNPIDDIYWLVTAQDLRSLRLVWHPESTSSWRHVFPVVRPRPSPTLLEKLSVEFVIQIQEGERDPERITRASEELHHASLPLIEFAAPLAHLKRLELDSSLDFFNIPTENGVFPALKEVRCPLYAADAFSRICNLTEIDLVRGRPELSSIMGRLDQFSVSQTNLTSLGVSLQDYEEEVLLGVSIMFRQLETLKITFVRREPSEVRPFIFSKLGQISEIILLASAPEHGWRLPRGVQETAHLPFIPPTATT